MARTSISGAISGAASGLAAICRAMSSSVIASTWLQSVARSASRAALLKIFAIALHFSLVRLAERDHPSFRFPVDINAYKKTIINQTEGHLAGLAIVKTIISHGQVRPGEQDLSQRERNPVLRPVHGILRRIEHASHTGEIRFWRIDDKSTANNPLSRSRVLRITEGGDPLDDGDQFGS